MSIGAVGVGRVLVDARHLGDEQQLVGLQRDRRARRHVFHRQVERLAGRREAERREQQHRADVDRAPDRRRVDLAHDAAVHEVDAVDDADRPRGQEVARDDAHDRVGHRRVRQALRERRLDLEAQLAGGLLGAVERDRVGDAQAVADSATRGPSSAAARSTCGRKPCTSTSLMPIACRIARSWANEASLPAAISSPAIATTKVLPWYAWMYGATVRNHGTKVCGKTRFTVRIGAVMRGSPQGGRDSVTRVGAAVSPRRGDRCPGGPRVARSAAGVAEKPVAGRIAREPAEARVDWSRCAPRSRAPARRSRRRPGRASAARARCARATPAPASCRLRVRWRSSAASAPKASRNAEAMSRICIGRAGGRPAPTAAPSASLKPVAVCTSESKPRRAGPGPGAAVGRERDVDDAGPQRRAPASAPKPERREAARAGSPAASRARRCSAATKRGPAGRRRAGRRAPTACRGWCRRSPRCSAASAS